MNLIKNYSKLVKKYLKIYKITLKLIKTLERFENYRLKSIKYDQNFTKINENLFFLIIIN